MNKRMKSMLTLVGLVFAGIFLYKGIMGFLLKYAMSHQVMLPSVSSMQVKYDLWTPKIAASGSSRAIRGVNVTSELAGMVETILFKPGANVEKDELLVQLNADNDIAQLHALEANEELAKITYQRDKAQYAIRAVSKQTLDSDEANLKNFRAQVAQQAAIVAKKRIKAPFSGRLGINLINPGQFINPGDSVVNLQTLDPIYVDFYIPQQQIAQLKIGQTVQVFSDTYPKKQFTGTITTINPSVDTATRNIAVEATIKNPECLLLPGMFVSTEIETGQAQQFLTLPQTAISFNPYGNVVYVLYVSSKNKDGTIVYQAKERFVQTGLTRGEQIQILSGLKEHDEVVSSGQLKIKNGSLVVINNDIKLPNNPNPILNNNH